MGADGAVGREDRGDRAAACGLAQVATRRVVESARFPTSRAQRHRNRGSHGAPGVFKVRARVRCLAGGRSPAHRYGVPSTDARHQQAGYKYLRTLLIHAARSALHNAKAPPPWLMKLAERQRTNVANVPAANKMARTIWALLTHDWTCPAELRERRTLGRARQASRRMMANRSDRGPLILNLNLDSSEARRPRLALIASLQSTATGCECGFVATFRCKPCSARVCAMCIRRSMPP